MNPESILTVSGHEKTFTAQNDSPYDSIGMSSHHALQTEYGVID